MDKKTFKDKQKLAISILKSKGIDHEEWLYEQYENIINDNISYLTDIIAMLEDK
jgi:hypothetical protein